MTQSFYKHFSLFLFLVLLFFCFQACKMNYSNDEYVEDAITHLKENYGGSYTYYNIQKSKNQTVVMLKAVNLNNKIINVKFDITEHTAFSISYRVSSNYFPQKFKEQEETYYSDIFTNNLFSDCKIIINNNKRYMPSVLNKDTTFADYLNEWQFTHTDISDFITIIAKEGKSHQFITWEDKLKASLYDFSDKSIILDGTFYLVDDIEAAYENNFMHKAVIKGKNNQYEVKK